MTSNQLQDAWFDKKSRHALDSVDHEALTRHRLNLTERLMCGLPLSLKREKASNLADKAIKECATALSEAPSLPTFLKALRFAFPHWGLRGLVDEAYQYHNWLSPTAHGDDTEGWILPFAYFALSSTDFAIFQAIHDGTIYQNGKIILHFDSWAARNPESLARLGKPFNVDCPAGRFKDLEYLERAWLGLGGKGQSYPIIRYSDKNNAIDFQLAQVSKPSPSTARGVDLSVNLLPYLARLREGSAFPMIALSLYNFQAIESLLNGGENGATT